MDIMDKFKSIDLSSINIPDYSYIPKFEIPAFPEIELGPSVQDKIDEQTEILEKCANNQIVELEKQNKELKKELETQTKVHISNYEELHQTYEQQQKEIDNNKKDGIINKTISIIAIIVAICAWLFPR